MLKIITQHIGKSTRKRKAVLAVLFVVMFGLGGVLGFYIRSQTVNPRATIPGPLSRLLSFFVTKGEGVEEDLLYHDTNLTSYIINGSAKTKVSVVGKVTEVVKDPDGDYHVIISDSFGLPLVTEGIPEIPMELPKLGDTVRLWGLTRFDIPHNWWEIHPIIGWEKQ
ncbi:hypothetical protein COV04_03010 [Candidatus Uhrbacteria bacterium CG10_big_fil_rev_8_21_14_0_10_48_11]|uniref:Uncharacterized protein n=1 Tax=Candidatus Uhrbacteria bacterium CG10_big_fil_rev_8_21_14_0_10_48_11 TaxID=1975037 RepID=A0A2M8LEL3_9BACT|nr:MAG: hypothetical protein COV04_03010 [Candidatus Uhrbacteria bacterium CG10_big_fil_rev_8_21_14_0_10_48_11]